MNSQSTHLTEPSLFDQFDRDGYLVFDPQLPSQLLERVVGDISPRFLDSDDVVKSKTGGVFYRNRIQDAFWFSDAARELAVYPSILQTLETIYQRKPFCFQTLHFRQGTQQAVHSDTIHFNSEPAGFMCGVWIALEDIDETNGPLIYYPGSHKYSEVTMADVGTPSHADYYPQYEEFIAARIVERKSPSQLGTIKKGQAIIWAANLLHGGSAIKNPSRTRFSQVSHYFFDGCSYSTPLAQKHRDPIRIYADRIVKPEKHRPSPLNRIFSKLRQRFN